MAEINETIIPIVLDEPIDKPDNYTQTEHIQPLYSSWPTSIKLQYDKRITALHTKNTATEDKAHAIATKIHTSYAAKRLKCKTLAQAQRDSLKQQKAAAEVIFESLEGTISLGKSTDKSNDNCFEQGNKP